LLQLVSGLFPTRCDICSGQQKDYFVGSVCRRCLEGIRPCELPYCSRCGRIFSSETLGELKGGFLCRRCLSRTSSLSMVRAFGVYDGAMRKLIHSYKYNGRVFLAGFLSRKLWESFLGKEIFCGVQGIVPVPLHRRREKARGFNQSEAVARGLAGRLHCEMLHAVVRRTRDTAPQAGLSLRARKRNVRGAFEVKSTKRIEGKCLLLIDDVVTTGATMEECGKVLLRGGAAEVRGICVARTLFV
jgi:ComF family protein